MWISLAALFGFLGVALGAFGAHALKARLGEALPIWQTAVLYHLVHAVAMLAVALYGKSTGQGIGVIVAFFAAGVLLFSGSLYILAITGIKALGAVTPLGGLCFLIGWAALAWRFR